jgi:5'-nucleotidase/UDP-sugar diphosphatase
MTPGSGAFPQTAGVRDGDRGRPAAIGPHRRPGPRPAARIPAGAVQLHRRGGDGYPKLDSHPGYVNTGFVDADVLRSYIARMSPLKPADYEPGGAVQRR